MFKYLALISLSLSTNTFAIEKAEGVVYCHAKTVIEYRLVNPEKNGTASDVDLTINGKTARYMTSYSWFGSNQPTPKNFKFAILGEGRFDPLLVFENRLVDAKNTQYSKCN
jgi:hypothetical protein